MKKSDALVGRVYTCHKLVIWNTLNLFYKTTQVSTFLSQNFKEVPLVSISNFKILSLFLCSWTPK
jgi:hypothetical protein